MLGIVMRRRKEREGKRNGRNQVRRKVSGMRRRLSERIMWRRGRGKRKKEERKT